MPDSNKKYKLLGADGEIYLSDTPGTFGGNGNLKMLMVTTKELLPSAHKLVIKHIAKN